MVPIGQKNVRHFTSGRKTVYSRRRSKSPAFQVATKALSWSEMVWYMKCCSLVEIADVSEALRVHALSSKCRTEKVLLSKRRRVCTRLGSFTAQKLTVLTLITCQFYTKTVNSQTYHYCVCCTVQCGCHLAGHDYVTNTNI